VLPDDLPTIEKLTEHEHFNVGLHNLRLFYEMSPDCWHVAIEDATGEIVAFDASTKLPTGAYMGLVSSD
jgi:hypothetical protein